MGTPDETRPQIDRYELLKELSGGVIAQRSLARREGSTALALIERVHEAVAEVSGFVPALTAQVRGVGRVVHPNLTQFYGLTRQDGAYIAASEYVQSRDLGEVRRRARSQGVALPAELAASWISQIAGAVHVLHTQARDADGLPLVHGAIAPSRILIPFQGRPKLTQAAFGRAIRCLAGAWPGVLETECAWMSPEHARKVPITPASDVFTLGAILCELVTGRQPFRRGNAALTLQALASAEEVRVAALGVPVPEVLAAALDRALAKDPAARWPSAEGMARAIEAFLFDSAITMQVEDAARWMSALFEQELRAGQAIVDLPGLGPVILPGPETSLPRKPRYFEPTVLVLGDASLDPLAEETTSRATAISAPAQLSAVTAPVLLEVETQLFRPESPEVDPQGIAPGLGPVTGGPGGDGSTGQGLAERTVVQSRSDSLPTDSAMIDLNELPDETPPPSPWVVASDRLRGTSGLSGTERVAPTSDRVATTLDRPERAFGDVPTEVGLPAPEFEEATSIPVPAVRPGSAAAVVEEVSDQDLDPTIDPADRRRALRTAVSGDEETDRGSSTPGVSVAAALVAPALERAEPTVAAPAPSASSGGGRRAGPSSAGRAARTAGGEEAPVPAGGARLEAPLAPRAGGGAAERVASSRSGTARIASGPGPQPASPYVIGVASAFLLGLAVSLGLLLSTPSRADVDLTVLSTPAGALISVDDQVQAARTPATIHGLRPGHVYDLKLTIEGRATVEQRLEVPKGPRSLQIEVVIPDAKR